MTIFIFILILVALIVVHEFGHFFAAKLFRIRVEEFGIGFPPRIVAKKIGDTVYSLNALFFGGFVRIFGENEEEAGDSKESFVRKPRLVQAAVVFAGVFCNVVFAWLALSLGYMAGLPTPVAHEGFGTVENAKVVLVGVLPGSPAANAGMEPGTSIVSIGTAAEQGVAPASSADAQEYIRLHAEQSLVIQTLSAEGTAETFIVKAAEGLVEDRKAIGVNLDDIGILTLPPHLALAQGAILTTRMTTATAEGLAHFFGRIFSGVADFSSVAGPIGITTIGAAAVESGFADALILTALISINLALINLLPIPGLDGGRLVVIGLEGLLRRRVPGKVLVSLSIAGFSLLILLMLVVSYHDVLRLIG